MFTYDEMKVERTIDGDTIVVYGEYAPDEFARKHVRLFGVNSPEVHGVTKEAGLAAAAFTKQQLEGRTIKLLVHGVDDFGRWLGDIYLDGQLFNQVLLDQHYAVPFKK
jgi:endonuclease YncB( thermonuclease family)